MSADNGIYIITENKKYRVFHAQNIEEIFDPETSWDFYNQYIIFAPFFDTRKEALEYAQVELKKCREYGPVEYGVVVLDYDATLKKVWKLKKAKIDPWLEALRSGKYKQTSACLCTDVLWDETKVDVFCCLGVYADVHGAKWKKNFLEDYQLASSGSYTALPGKGKYGLPADLQEYLTIMNDGGRTFEEIADWIEANVEIIP